MLTVKELLGRLTIEELLKIKKERQAITITIAPEDVIQALKDRKEELERFLNALSEDDAITDLPPS